MRLFLDEKPAYLLSVLENKIPLTDADQYLITILAQHAEYLLNRMHSNPPPAVQHSSLFSRVSCQTVLQIIWVSAICLQM